MKNKKNISYCIFFFWLFLFSFSLYDGKSMITYNMEKKTWKTSEQINLTKSLNVYPSLSFNLTDTSLYNFSSLFIPHTIYFSSYFNFTSQNGTIYIKKYTDRTDSLCVYGTQNSTLLFSLSKNMTHIISFHILFLPQIKGSNGTFFGYNFTAFEQYMLLDHLFLSYNVWYKIELHYYYSVIRIIEYQNKNQINNYTLPMISTTDFSFSCVPYITSELLYLSGFQHYSYSDFSFEYNGILQWNPYTYWGENTTEINIKYDIQIPNTYRIYSFLSSSYYSSLFIITYRNPLVYSRVRSFYIAKIFAEKPYYMFSENLTNWYIITDTILYLQCTNTDVINLTIGNYSINSDTVLSSSSLPSDTYFQINYDGYTDNSFFLLIEITGNGYVPEIKYTINCVNQDLLNKQAYIEIIAYNISNTSGIFWPNGTLLKQINDGYTKYFVKSKIGVVEYTYIIILYDLINKMVVKQLVSLIINYIPSSQQSISKSKYYWYYGIGSGCISFLSALIFKKIKKTQKQISNLDSYKSPKIYIPTYYTNIGFIPENCKVENNELICNFEKNE